MESPSQEGSQEGCGGGTGGCGLLMGPGRSGWCWVTLRSLCHPMAAKSLSAARDQGAPPALVPGLPQGTLGVIGTARMQRMQVARGLLDTEVANASSLLHRGTGGYPHHFAGKPPVGLGGLRSIS